MFSIILSLYAIIVIIYILASIFIAYHIVKYSLNHAIEIATLLFFVIGSFVLFIFNFGLMLFIFFSFEFQIGSAYFFCHNLLLIFSLN